jgi:hypothetical protein
MPRLSRIKRFIRLYTLFRKRQLEVLKAQLESLKQELKETSAAVRQEEVEVLHRGTGSAITSWAIMEERLIMVASLLLKTAPEKVGLVFFSIVNFQVWLSIITELFELAPEFSGFQRRWNKLYERLRAEKDIRDRLAHHAVLSATVTDNPFGRSVKKASRIDFRAKSRALKPLVIEEVNDFSERIGNISDDLLKLVDDMRSHLHHVAQSSSPEKSSAQAPDQAT